MTHTVHTNDSGLNERTAKLSRRHFIIGSVIAASTVGVVLAARDEKLKGTLLSAYEDARGDQFIGGVRLENGEIFGARVPVRAHGCAVHPGDPDRTLFFARRPGTQAFELQHSTLHVRKVFETPAGRHLAGHGTFSKDGQYLFTPEHDFERVRGILAVRDTRDYRIVAEIDTHGIDPHEVVWHSPTQLFVANGGILTHPRSFRRKLNIPTMDPSLCLIDAASGQCLEQWRLPDHQLSIRHLSVANDGRAVAALQYEGDPKRAPSVLAIYHPGVGLKILDAPAEERAKFQVYAASVAVSTAEDLVAVACPYGNGVACWSLQNERYLGFVRAIEPYGITALADGSIATSQRDGAGYLFQQERLARPLHLRAANKIRWDDHWIAV